MTHTEWSDNTVHRLLSNYGCTRGKRGKIRKTGHTKTNKQHNYAIVTVALSLLRQTSLLEIYFNIQSIKQRSQSDNLMGIRYQNKN